MNEKVFNKIDTADRNSNSYSIHETFLNWFLQTKYIIGDRLAFLCLLGILSNPMGINVNKFLIARYCFILQNKLACNNTLLSIILHFQKIKRNEVSTI